MVPSPDHALPQTRTGGWVGWFGRFRLAAWLPVAELESRQPTRRLSISMRYYKGRWHEDRGDEFASWGCSDWYFEVQADNTVVRQMEVYDSGAVLQYYPQHLVDLFGMLTDQPFDPEGFPVSPITSEEFDQAWSSHPPTNLPPFA